MKIFPKEIINSTSEKYFSRFSRQSGTIYLSTIILLVLFLAALPLVQVDISVQSRGIIRSREESCKLLSPVTGQIEKILIHENQQIKKGDTLLCLKKDRLTENILLIERKTNEIDLFIADIENILDFNYQKLVSPRYISDHARYRQKLKDFDLQIAQLRHSYERAKMLYEKTVIPKTEFEQAEFEFLQKKEEKSLYAIQTRSEWNTALAQYKIEKASLETEKKQALQEEKFYSIVAGLDGCISNFAGLAPGDFVLANQTIADIVPTGNLIAESYVTTEDVGYVHVGMKAYFQIDAYNYNEWGLATGKVIDISNQPVQEKGMYFFKVKCCLYQNSLSLKSGYRGTLKKRHDFNFPVCSCPAQFVPITI